MRSAQLATRAVALAARVSQRVPASRIAMVSALLFVLASLLLLALVVVLMRESESATALPMAIVQVMALASALVTGTALALVTAARLSVPQSAAPQRPAAIVPWV